MAVTFIRRKHLAEKMTSPSIDEYMGLGAILNGRDYFKHDGGIKFFASMSPAHKVNRPWCCYVDLYK